MHFDGQIKHPADDKYMRLSKRQVAVEDLRLTQFVLLWCKQKPEKIYDQEKFDVSETPWNNTMKTCTLWHLPADPTRGSGHRGVCRL